MYDGFSELPGFTTVKQNGLYSGIEDPDFGVVGVCCRSPDCIECYECASGFLNSFCLYLHCPYWLCSPGREILILAQFVGHQEGVVGCWGCGCVFLLFCWYWFSGWLWQFYSAVAVVLSLCRWMFVPANIYHPHNRDLLVCQLGFTLFLSECRRRRVKN